MPDTLIIARREFRERVQSRSFLIGTLLFPLFMAGLIVLPQVIRGGGQRKLAVVDESGASLTGRFTDALAALHTDTADATSYTVEPVPTPLPRVRDELNRRVRAEELDGYVVFPADVLERNEVQYRARSIANFDVMRDLRLAASRAVQAERLRRAGLDGGEVASLVRPVEISGARITAEGEEGGSAVSTFWLAYMVAFLVYFMTAFYGTSVMRSVLEEKTNRIAEVMVSSVRASHLMAGKILGVGAAAMLQVLIWGVMIWLVATQSDLITRRFNLPPGALRVLSIDPGVGLLFILFFALGFLLFSSIYAAVGAAVSSEQEAQSLQFAVLVPLLVPLIFLASIAGEPRGTLATVLGQIPLTAPIAMPMRLAAAPIPMLEVLSSLVLLVAGLAAVSWIAGKIYRIGILSTGKKPTLAEVVRWVRTA